MSLHLGSVALRSTRSIVAAGLVIFGTGEITAVIVTERHVLK